MPTQNLRFDSAFDSTLDAPRAPVRPYKHQATSTKVLHWASAAAMVLATSSVLIREVVESPMLRNVLMDVHRQSGLFVLVALVWRLAVRFQKGMVDNSGPAHWLVKMAAQGAHLALYAMLAALPLLGWAVCNAHDAPLTLLGIPLPHLVQPDSDLADTLTDYHVMAAWCMLPLVVAHVAASIWHHRVARDGVLLAMLPRRTRSR